MNFRTVLLSGCAIVAIYGQPAYAQESASPAATASDSDIVVTARRREEKILDVPVAITAISGQSLSDQGVTKVSELGQVAPGLGVTATATGGRSRPVYELRGIFPNDVLSGQDQSVGIYINDVYLARPSGTNQSMFDIENVQVLYGPQGTLFGRNTPAGAILISTKKPVDRAEGEFWGGFGKYNEVTVGSVLNVPLGDKAQLRVGGQYMKRDGYTTNIANGQLLDDENNYVLRASLRVLPADNVENITVFDYFNSDTNFLSGTLELVGQPGQTVTMADGHVVNLSSGLVAANRYPTAPAVAAAQLARGPRQVMSDVLTDSKDLSWGVSNTTAINLDSGLTIKNIMGYRKNTSSQKGDTDRSILTVLTSNPEVDQSQFSEELQLQGNSFGGKLNWILGAYYFHENGGDRSLPTRNAIGTTGYTATTNDFRGITTSKSLFFQGTYSVLDNLNSTGGLRYNWDNRRGVYNNPRLLERGNPVVPAGTCLLAQTAGTATTPAEIDVDGDCHYEASVAYKRATYTLTLDYKPTDALMLYVSHRKGYRAGGFNGRGTNRVNTAPFRPEIVSDIELGAKADVPLGGDARLTFDLAVYRTKYNDLQRSAVVNDPFRGPTTTVINAAKGTINGFEAKFNLRVMPELSIGASWAHNDGKYDQFDGVSACPVLNTACAAAAQVLVSVKNVPFGTAKDTVTGNVVVTPIDTPEFGKVSATASFNYRSSWFLQNDVPVLVVPVEARSLVNLALGWDNIKGSGASIEASVRNLFNKTYRAAGLSTMTSQGFAVYYYGDPRMYGVTLRYKFGN